ncbi:ATP-dependent RNA helicase RhlB [Candidatus Calditenuaceae archaeon HR02]|nr:ATP-dependent RNA helicase RhlB [Candidatus Calditenuaceae archaeon HR02]
MRVWDVPSQEDPSKTYRVTFDGEKFTCTCPDYVYRAKKQGRDCKHIYAVKVAEGLLASPTPNQTVVQERTTEEVERVEMRQFVTHPMVRTETIEDRDYQRGMVGGALKGNTLVVLPTALGKTVIAELVAAELLHRHPRCRILMMAPTKPLVLQHRQSFLKHLNISEGEAVAVTGEVVDTNRRMVWENPSIRLVFSTPQTAYNDYRRGWIRLEEFALLVFDECHRSRSRYAYTRLASEYVRKCPWPRILGLTASPGSEEERVLEVVKNLWIERIVWRTEEDEDVSSYIPGVKVAWVKLGLPQSYEAIRSRIKRMIESTARQLQTYGLLRSPLEGINRKVIVQLMARLRAEIDSGVKGQNMHYVALCSELLSLYHALELIESQHAYSLREYLREISNSELKSHKMLSRRPEFQELVRMAEKCSEDHSKVEALLALVDQHLREKPGDRIMVFANIRHTAEILVERLRSRGVSAHLFIGKGEGKMGPRMSQEEQKKILDAFRRGEFKVLVATSIGEEGLDIPECGYVIFYEPAVSGIRYIQRRGRTGRRLPGKVTILITEKTVDEYYFREGYRRARKMAKILENVSKKLSGFKVERRGPEPKPGEPWPWRRDALEVVVEGELEKTKESEPSIDTSKISYGELLRCRRELYDRLLEAGVKGLSMADAMDLLSHSPDIVRISLNRLVRDGLVVKSGERYVAKAAVKASKAPEKVHEIMVEKIYPGFAIVVVDDRFRARLDATAYNGPRDLIKKGKVFKALATIHKIDGKTTIVIHDVVRT